MPSFNVQNAKSLEITEGDMATIHDADGRQLWGKLNYTTKYQGDTEQTTYTGKNLENFLEISYVATNEAVVTRTDGVYTIETGTSRWGACRFVSSVLSLSPDTTYTMSAKIDSTDTTDGAIILVGAGFNVDGEIQSNFGKTGDTISVTFTTPSTISTSSAWINILPKEANKTAVFSHLQLETGSTATAYEPYVGGIPAPNPDYPQPISVVTGTQTVTLTGGTVSEDYTVHLGTLELAKIGTYQDYIYKDGSDWKLHKAIDKVEFDGSEDEYWSASNTGTPNFFYTTRYFYYAPGLDPLSNNFAYATISSSNTAVGFMTVNNTQLRFRPDFAELSTADWRTWLSTHNTIVYYALATPTDTQITDTSLIAELDAIEEWMTRCGYTATIAGNLPIVINQTEIV